MPQEPICPNDELDRLREILEESQPERIGQHTLQSVAFVLGRLRDAQAQGRVLPDPNDSRTWQHKMRDWVDEEIASLMARRAERNTKRQGRR